MQTSVGSAPPQFEFWLVAQEIPGSGCSPPSLDGELLIAGVVEIGKRMARHLPMPRDFDQFGGDSGQIRLALAKLEDLWFEGAISPECCPHSSKFGAFLAEFGPSSTSFDVMPTGRRPSFANVVWESPYLGRIRLRFAIISVKHEGGRGNGVH